MVAIVSGQNLGLGLGKVNGLNDPALGQGQVGQNGQQVSINAATGNLVVQDQDTTLLDNGLDLGALRTYNSQGQFNTANGPSWAQGAAVKSVAVSGTLAADGSTVIRTDRDGSQTVYLWNDAAKSYLPEQSASSTEGIAVVNGQLVWSDGATGQSETYDATSGRLLSATDATGHQATYSYNSDGTLASVVSDTGDATYYDYQNGNLADVREKTQDASGNWLTQTIVSYGYDALNRLTSVTIDLSPSDNSTTDGNVYTTTYGYDGSSDRLASITQSDGTSLNFTYQQVGGEYRVATVTDGLQQTTTFTYDVTNGITTIQDPQSAVMTLHFDSAGRVVEMDQPADGGGTSSAIFKYDANGNLAQAGGMTYGYDANGNRISSVDAQGDTTGATYNADNQITSQTVYGVAAANGNPAGNPQTTYYYYDASSVSGAPGLLRYVVTPAGQLTEYRYNAQGQRISTLRYTAQTIAAGNLTGSETTAAIAALVAAATPAADSSATSRTDVQRADTAYDAHGQVSSITVYSAVSNDADLTGIAADGSTTKFVYDQSGRLLTKIAASGEQTSYGYDGLGRLTGVVDTIKGTASTQYEDASSTVVQNNADGSSTTSVYDADGRLVTSTSTSNGTINTYYDADGRVTLTKNDGSATQTWTFYDAQGGVSGVVTQSGTLTEYVRNAAGQATQTIVYANSVNVSLLPNNTGDIGVSLDAIRPAASANDQKSWQIFDAAGRLTDSVTGSGIVTQTQYDGASHVLQTTVFANPIDVSSLGSAPTVAGLGIVVQFRDETARLAPVRGSEPA